jgi:hypothetical protein
VCATRDLDVTVVHPAVAAGSVQSWLRFRKRGGPACDVTGYPEVVGVDIDGRRTIATHTLVATGFPSIEQPVEVTLTPGATAYAAFLGGDIPPNDGPCPPSFTRLEVVPPRGSSPAVVSAFNAELGQDLPGCDGLFVTSIVPAALVPEIDASR